MLPPFFSRVRLSNVHSCSEYFKNHLSPNCLGALARMCFTGSMRLTQETAIPVDIEALAEDPACGPAAKGRSLTEPSLARSSSSAGVGLGTASRPQRDHVRGHEKSRVRRLCEWRAVLSIDTGAVPH